MTTCDFVILFGAINIYVALCVCSHYKVYAARGGEVVGYSFYMSLYVHKKCVIYIPPQRPPHSPPTGHLAVHLKMLVGIC